jgi:hypothetical protein
MNTSDWPVREGVLTFDRSVPFTAAEIALVERPESTQLRRSACAA